MQTPLVCAASSAIKTTDMFGTPVQAVLLAAGGAFSLPVSFRHQGVGFARAGSASKFDALLFPDPIMPMLRSNERMSDLVQYRVDHLLPFISKNIVARKLDSVQMLFANAKLPSGTVELERPTVKPMLLN